MTPAPNLSISERARTGGRRPLAILDPSASERDTEKERFRALRETGDAALRDEIVEDYLWIAHHAARRFAGRGEAAEDLFQVASLGLVNAVDRFDPERNVRFATFAMPTAVGELRRHFRDRTWSVKVSRRVKDLHLEIRAASEQLTHLLSRRPTVEELATELGVSVEQILEAIEAGASYRAASLDGPADATSDDGPEAPAQGLPDDVVEATPERVAVRESLTHLSQRDRKAVYFRYYLGMSQAEIAQRLGISQVHVSRILRASLAKLGDGEDLRALEAG
ncbi:MAG: SigB/SigF/SigG family RNA polymerase sigma factor [Actinomycetota bacterium]